MGRFKETDTDRKKSKIAELRKKRGWTQKYLAEITGYSEIYIKRIELAQVPNPSIKAFYKIAYALSTSVDDLWKDYERIL